MFSSQLFFFPSHLSSLHTILPVHNFPHAFPFTKLSSMNHDPHLYLSGLSPLRINRHLHNPDFQHSLLLRSRLIPRDSLRNPQTLSISTPFFFLPPSLFFFPFSFNTFLFVQQVIQVLHFEDRSPLEHGLPLASTSTLSIPLNPTAPHHNSRKSYESLPPSDTFIHPRTNSTNALPSAPYGGKKQKTSAKGKQSPPDRE